MDLKNLRQDMANNGYQFKDNFISDGKIKRFSLSGKDKDGYCQVFDNSDFFHAEYGDWKTGNKYKWNSTGGELNRKQVNTLKQAQKDFNKGQEQEHQQAKIKANKIYQQAQKNTVFNAYLKSKKFDEYRDLKHPARQDEQGNLIIPLSNIDNEIQSIQTIFNNGNKQLLKGGSKKGNFCVLGNLSSLSNDIYICEGYATALTVYLAFEQTKAVIFAVDCGNLMPVILKLKEKYKDKTFINCADNDHTKELNAGIEKAKKIKNDLGISYVYPDFIKGSDFDDLRQEKGLDEVKNQLNNIITEIKTEDKEPNVLDKILESVELFKNEVNEPFATLENGNTVKINSTLFKDWLIMAYYKQTDKYLKDSQVKDIGNHIRSMAIYGNSNKKHKVFNRIGHSADNESVFIDLVDENNNFIEINKDGWSVVTSKKSKVKFERNQNMQSLPYPTGKGDINKLWQHTNITNDTDKKLVLAWLINCFIPFNGYPVLVFYGGQGTAKSTTQSNLRDLIDPSTNNLRIKSNSADFLGIQAINNYMVSLENLGSGREGLSANEQNTLCSISTGGSISERKKYTDNEESMKVVKNPIMLNGISSFVTAQDLIDRSVILELEAIQTINRIDDTDIKQAFIKDKPEVLGALLDLTANVFKILPSIKSNELPRMAGYGKIGLALERIMDWDNSFLECYKNNQHESITEVLDSEPVMIVLRGFLSNRGNNWVGYWKDLLGFLKDEAPSHNFTLEKITPRGLSAKIKQNARVLKTVGIGVKFLKRDMAGSKVGFTGL